MKFIYDKIDINIPVGSQSFSQSKTLKKGTCVGVKIVHVSSQTPVNQTLNVNVGDGNNTLLGATDFRDFIGNGGGYRSAFKPCEFDASLQVTIDAIAEAAIATADFKAQLIFMIKADCNE